MFVMCLNLMSSNAHLPFANQPDIEGLEEKFNTNENVPHPFTLEETKGTVWKYRTQFLKYFAASL